MTEIRTEIDINAPAEKVWGILQDFKKYPEWNPFIKHAEGIVLKGEFLKVHIEPPGRKGMIFQPQILKAESNRELRWKGKFLIPGLFDGEHSFVLKEVSPQKTKLIHAEKFTGIFIPLFKRMLSDTERGFEMMNEALRKRAEDGGEN
ncbi:MAG TPA: SRPBCC domain-containing protein [Patescibacteria group bacterium]|nr:SRPBCC domain-containing protein [Patescibacteria group bacterium]